MTPGLFKKYILPALCTLLLLPACKKNCQECHVYGEGPFETIEVDNSEAHRLFGARRDREECQALADSLNRDDSDVYHDIFTYRYYCSCDFFECN